MSLFTYFYNDVYVGTAAAEARRAFGSMAARDSLDEIRDEDDSRSDSDFSDKQGFGDLSVSSKWALLLMDPGSGQRPQLMLLW